MLGKNSEPAPKGPERAKMLVEGFLVRPERSGGYWAVEIPALHIHTQGKTRKEGLEMAKDAVEMLSNKEGFEVQVLAKASSERFAIESNNAEFMAALILKQTRAFAGLSVREVARRMNSSSPNAYSQYERGDRSASLGQFCQMMKAMGCSPVIGFTVSSDAPSNRAPAKKKRAAKKRRA